jgi:hypothetical protein
LASVTEAAEPPVWFRRPSGQVQIDIVESVVYIADSFNPSWETTSMGLLNLLPREEQYFDLFSQMTLYICDAARELKEMLADKNQDYGEYAQRIKGLEHACDELTHSISTRLNKSFITPFDREDIYMMSTALDDIVDLIDDAARAIIIFDIKEITDYARDFADVIERLAEQLKAIVGTLSSVAILIPITPVTLNNSSSKADA